MIFAACTANRQSGTFSPVEWYSLSVQMVLAHRYLQLLSFCLHKHAWKLIDSIDGARYSAILYSITETAKVNHLNPFRYLNHVLTVLKGHQNDTDYSFIEELLP